MNKKLLVMVMVPVLVVMSGALAFSAFSGSITTNVNASAGYLSWQQNETSHYTYMHNTEVGTNFSDGTYVKTSTSGPNVTTQDISVTNLAPGNWIEFNFTVYNTGSVGLMLTHVSVSTMGANGANMSVSSNDFMYGSALNVSADSSFAYLYNVSSIPSGSIDQGSSTTYHVYLGMNEYAGNMYQESTFSLTVQITVTSDP